MYIYVGNVNFGIALFTPVDVDINVFVTWILSSSSHTLLNWILHKPTLTHLLCWSQNRSTNLTESKLKALDFCRKFIFVTWSTILSFPPGIRGVVYICKSLKTNVLLRSQKQYIRICIVSFMLILTLIRSPVHIRIFAIFCLSSLQYLRCIAYQIS